MKQNADLGRRVLLPTALTVTPLIHQALIPHIHILRILPALIVPIPTALRVIPALAQAIWQTCLVPAAIICTMIPPAELFIATAK